MKERTLFTCEGGANKAYLKEDVREMQCVLGKTRDVLKKYLEQEQDAVLNNPKRDAHELSYLEFADEALVDVLHWIQALLEVIDVPAGARNLFEPSWLKNPSTRRESDARRNARIKAKG